MRVAWSSLRSRVHLGGGESGEIGAAPAEQFSCGSRETEDTSRVIGKLLRAVTLSSRLWVAWRSVRSTRLFAAYALLSLRGCWLLGIVVVISAFVFKFTRKITAVTPTAMEGNAGGVG
jgi:hypothetical protein